MEEINPNFLIPYSPATASRIKPKNRAGKTKPGTPEGRYSQHRTPGSAIPISDYIIKGFGDSGTPRVSSKRRQETGAPIQFPSAQQNPWKMQRLAASYEPDLNNSSVLIENVMAKLKTKIRSLLAKPPHSDELKKMQQEFKS
jgi:hypothetical protein